MCWFACGTLLATPAVRGQRSHVNERQADALSDAHEARRPRLRLPLAFTYTRSFDQDVVMLEPGLPAGAQSDWTRVYLFSGGAIQAMRATDGRMMWDEPVAQAIQPDLLLATDEAAVFATGHEVFALAAANGRRLWAVGQRPTNLNRPQTDPESFVAIAARTCHDGRLFVLREDGRAASLEVSTGKALWQRELNCRPTGRLAVSDRYVAFRGRGGDQDRYYVVDAASGQLARAIPLPGQGYDLRLHLTSSDRLVAVRSQSVHCIDAAKGSPLWRFDASGHILDATLTFSAGGLYLSDDGLRLVKLGLDDGMVSWQSEPSLRFNRENPRLTLEPAALLLLAESRVVGLDPASGRRIWETSPPRAARFRDHFVGASHIVSVTRPIDDHAGSYSLYFTNIRKRPGRVSPTGEPLKLGAFSRLPQMTLRDDAFILRDGRDLLGWVYDPNETP